jgi:hypothetical protein
MTPIETGGNSEAGTGGGVWSGSDSQEMSHKHASDAVKLVLILKSIASFL